MLRKKCTKPVLSRASASPKCMHSLGLASLRVCKCKVAQKRGWVERRIWNSTAKALRSLRCWGGKKSGSLGMGQNGDGTFLPEPRWVQQVLGGSSGEEHRPAAFSFPFRGIEAHCRSASGRSRAGQFSYQLGRLHYQRHFCTGIRGGKSA